jgi:hypothetical protein
MMKKLRELIEEYFYMVDGEHIENYLYEIIFSNGNIKIKITYRSLKHIVEQRKRDNYSIERIHQMFKILHNILQSHSYTIIPNTEMKNNFFLFESVFSRVDSIYIVIELVLTDSNSYYIKTGFFRKIKKIKNL